MSAKFGEPEVISRTELVYGDQVACSDASPRLRPMVGDNHDEEPVWLTMGGGEHQRLLLLGWTIANLPHVLARQAIA